MNTQQLIERRFIFRYDKAHQPAAKRRWALRGLLALSIIFVAGCVHYGYYGGYYGPPGFFIGGFHHGGHFGGHHSFGHGGFGHH